MAEWIKKTRQTICYLQETQFRFKWGIKQYTYANGNQKRSGVAILLSNKVDLKYFVDFKYQ